MDLRCEDVRNDALPLSEERAEAIARHLDGCEACDRDFQARIASTLGALPAGGAPSLTDVRRRIRNDRHSFFVRFAAAAAAAMIVLGTGWAVLRHEQPAAVRPLSKETPPVEVPIPDPPKLAEIPEVDRKFIVCDGIVAYYLQFCLSCLNRPTEEDKREFLIRALLVLREVRSSMRARCEKGTDTVEVITRDALIEALQTMRASPLESVKLLPAKFIAFRYAPQNKWQFDHLLGKTPYRLTIDAMPIYVNFAYLKTALGADDAQMRRIEDALWFDLYVDLPKRVEDRDPKIPAQALQAAIPLLTPRQQKIYRKIVGPP
jgi:hypothetical protein